MLKQTIILLFSLIYINAHEKQDTEYLEGMFNQLQKDIFEPKECYPKMIAMYLTNEGPERSSVAGDNEHDLCPSIRQTCCNYEQLVEVHGKAKESYEKFLKFSKILQDLVKKINSMSEEQMANINSKFEQNSHCKLDDDEEDIFESAYQYLTKSKDDVIESFETGSKFYARKNAGFACALCDQASHAAMRIKRKQAPVIQLDYKQCKYFYQSPELVHYVTSLVAIRQLYNFFTPLSCISEQKKIVKRDVISSIAKPEDLEKVLGYYQNCGKDKNMQKDKQCQAACKDDNFFNVNYFAKFYEDILAFYLLGDDLINYTQPDMEKLSDIYDSKKKELFFNFYVAPLNVKTRIDRFPLEYSYGTGWNILAHEFVTRDAFIKTNSKGIKTIILAETIEKLSFFLISSFIFFWFK